MKLKLPFPRSFSLSLSNEIPPDLRSCWLCSQSHWWTIAKNVANKHSIIILYKDHQFIGRGYEKKFFCFFWLNFYSCIDIPHVLDFHLMLRVMGEKIFLSTTLTLELPTPTNKQKRKKAKVQGDHRNCMNCIDSNPIRDMWNSQAVLHRTYTS